VAFHGFHSVLISRVTTDDKRSVKHARVEQVGV